MILNDLFELELNNLPNSITKISICIDRYDKELNSLPESIEYIELPQKYKLQIKKFPSNLKSIKCHKDYPFIKNFSNYEVIRRD